MPKEVFLGRKEIIVKDSAEKGGRKRLLAVNNFFFFKLLCGLMTSVCETLI